MQQPNYKTEMFDKHPNLRAKLWCAGSDCEFRLGLLCKKFGVVLPTRGAGLETYPPVLQLLAKQQNRINNATPKTGERIFDAYWLTIYDERETSTAHIKPD